MGASPASASVQRRGAGNLVRPDFVELLSGTLERAGGHARGDRGDLVPCCCRRPSHVGNLCRAIPDRLGSHDVDLRAAFTKSLIALLNGIAATPVCHQSRGFRQTLQCAGRAGETRPLSCLPLPMSVSVRPLHAGRRRDD